MFETTLAKYLEASDQELLAATNTFAGVLTRQASHPVDNGNLSHDTLGDLIFDEPVTDIIDDATPIRFSDLLAEARDNA